MCVVHQTGKFVRLKSINRFGNDSLLKFSNMTVDVVPNGPHQVLFWQSSRVLFCLLFLKGILCNNAKNLQHRAVASARRTLHSAVATIAGVRYDLVALEIGR